MQELLGTYPVRNLQEMDVADNYFVAHKYNFSSPDRRQYAQELAYTMKTAGLDVPEHIMDYTGPRRGDISAGIHFRKVNSPESFHARLDAIEKIASYAEDSEVLTRLDRIDHEIGLNRRYHVIPDPVQTLFMSEKTAMLADEVWRGDTDSLRRSKLENWVKSSHYHELMKKHFRFDLVDGLRTDPWPVFSSLPDPHKKIIARMCNDESIGSRPSGQSNNDVGGALDTEELYQPASETLKELERLHGTNKDRILSRLSRL